MGLSWDIRGTAAAYARLVTLESLLTLKVKPSHAGSCGFFLLLFFLGGWIAHTEVKSTAICYNFIIVHCKYSSTELDDNSISMSSFIIVVAISNYAIILYISVVNVNDSQGAGVKTFKTSY